mmetsp:Transcript_46217/g.100454  ORF Transcript_46217/g.100454 Transcript_46217/m.100454 type:complete len:386 (-) Transcript_46217:58-1215(-)
MTRLTFPFGQTGKGLQFVAALFSIAPSWALLLARNDTNPSPRSIDTSAADDAMKLRRVGEEVFSGVSLDLVQLAAESPLAAGSRLLLLAGEQKCGTSEVFYTITQHPKLLAGRDKELHFFDKVVEVNEDRLKSYLNAFAAPETLLEGMRFVDGTPDVLSNPKAAYNTAAVFPFGLKVLVMIRDPIDRAHSAWDQVRRAGFESRSFEDAIAQEMPSALKCSSLASAYFEHSTQQDPVALDAIESDYFDLCSLPPQARCWQRMPEGGLPQCKQYLMKGLFDVHLQFWRRYHGSEAIHILRSEDFYEASGSEDPAVALRSLTTPLAEFLKVEPFEDIIPKTDCYHDCDVSKTLIEDVLSPRTRSQLRDLYRPSMMRLALMTGMYWPGW